MHSKSGYLYIISAISNFVIFILPLNNCVKYPVLKYAEGKNGINIRLSLNHAKQNGFSHREKTYTGILSHSTDRIEWHSKYCT